MILARRGCGRGGRGGRHQVQVGRLDWGAAEESGAESIGHEALYRYRILKIPVSTSRGALYFGADESTENDYPRSA
eukprot:SAG31_NODE_4293_length_3375_cov_6.098901_2_plen_75_part_01